MTSQKLKDIQNRLDDQAKDYFHELIPEYQTGYCDYIYQTSDYDVQQRRLKYISKLFQFWQKKPWYYVMPFSQDSSDLLTNWQLTPERVSSAIIGNPQILTSLEQKQTSKENWYRLIYNGIWVACLYFEEMKAQVCLHLIFNPEKKNHLEADLLNLMERQAKDKFPQKPLLFQVASSQYQVLALLQESGYQLHEAQTDPLGYQYLIKN